VLVSKATTSLTNIIIMTMSKEFFIDGYRSISKLHGFGEHIISRLVKVG